MGEDWNFPPSRAERSVSDPSEHVRPHQRTKRALGYATAPKRLPLVGICQRLRRHAVCAHGPLTGPTGSTFKGDAHPRSYGVLAVNITPASEISADLS